MVHQTLRLELYMEHRLFEDKKVSDHPAIEEQYRPTV
jgi:hypothetical protein